MNLRIFPSFAAVSALMAAGTMLSAPAAMAQTAAASEQQDMQILTRGPVHEAFAESVSFDPQAGLIVRAKPPEPIEELPPEQQLEGDNVTWIAGYWAWDDEHDDFIWISGIWRNLPPGRQWVPGYWSDLGGGQYQWTSGYWADSTVNEVSYISEAPPRNIDVGPNIAATSDDQSWIPGNWVWMDNRYLWRPGYWLPLRNDWTWVPSRYNWTRRGYVYVDGYWDYAVASRGVIFAPVYFHRPVYRSLGYYYTPSIVIGLNVFADHLFVRPRYHHYYFGDYYAPLYRDRGYYDSYYWHSRRRGYDPICAYERWRHRGDRDWDHRRRDHYNRYRDNEHLRPPRTWSAMEDYRRRDGHRDGSRVFADSLANVVKAPGEGRSFRSIDSNRRDQFVSQRQEMRKFGQERNRLEARPTAARDLATPDVGKRASAVRENFSRSPVVGRQAEGFTKRDAPPARPEPRGGERLESARERLQAAGRGNEVRERAGEGRDRVGESRERVGETRERGGEGRIAPPATRDREALAPDRRGALSGAAREGAGVRESVRPPASREAPAADTNRQRPQQLDPRSRATTPQPQRATETVTPPRRDSGLKPEARELPKREPQVTPQRPTPQTQVRPEVRPTPQRQAPQVRPEVRQAPQRPAPQVRPEVRPTPQRQAPQVRPEVRQAPQRQVQPQIRQAPQVRPEMRQAPQRQVQPQIRQAPQPQVRPSGGGGSSRSEGSSRENTRERFGR